MVHPVPGPWCCAVGHQLLPQAHIMLQQATPTTNVLHDHCAMRQWDTVSRGRRKGQIKLCSSYCASCSTPQRNRNKSMMSRWRLFAAYAQHGWRTAVVQNSSRQTATKEQTHVNKPTIAARPSSAHRSNLRTTSMRLGTCQVQRPGSRQWTSVRSQKETRRIKLTQTRGQGSRGLHLMPLPGAASGAGQTSPRPGTAPESSATATSCKYTFFVDPRL